MERWHAFVLFVLIVHCAPTPWRFRLLIALILLLAFGGF
jgi:hypothetical protein